MDPFDLPISRHVWDTRYRWRAGGEVRDATIQDTWDRVAWALAAAESDLETWAPRFRAALQGFRFLPGGRIAAGAGTHRKVTLFNCFVMGRIPDDLAGIFAALQEGALTMQQGGGIGYDFSTLRPAGSENRTTGTIASGPVSFLHLWDAMCATVLSTGARRGAMMATLRCDHPDIEAFVDAKRAPGALSRFNLSVLVTDAFMEAVHADADWPLVFPADQVPGATGATVQRAWSGRSGPVPCRVLRTVRARALWDRVLRSTYDHAEPGVLFVDRINREDNLAWREPISATNPCGEIPLPPYGACDLGSLNLVAFVREPFTPRAHLDLDALLDLVPVAVRMLDDVVDVSGFPLPAQARVAHATRRVGLGITGLADALILLGLHYGTPEARTFAADLLRCIAHTAYRTSIDLAREKGPCPAFDAAHYLERPFIQRLPEDLRADLARHGLRNSHLLAIAPTGTISLLANNVSSGIEPVFSFAYTRKVLGRDGNRTAYRLEDAAWRLFRAEHPDAPLPDAFATALELTPTQHLEMQAALQPFVDNAISKTINVPEDADFETFRSVYDLAWERGLKGCTTYRPNPTTGAVLEPEQTPAAVHCCTLDREDAA